MKTLLELYERNAWLNAHREIYVCGAVRRTYRQFLARIRQLSSALQRAGVDRQDRVGILAANSIEYFEVYGACEAGSFIAAAFNFRSAEPELDYLLDHSRPRVLFFDAAGAATVAGARTRASQIAAFVYIGDADEAPDWSVPFELFLAQGDPAGVATRPAPDDVCNLFYTSGTTGRPKGVPYTHQALLITAQRTALEEETSLLQVTPAFHVGGRCPSLGAIWRGGKVVLHTSFEPAEWLETVQRERINTTFMVPTMMQAVLDHPRFPEYDLSSLAWVMG